MIHSTSPISLTLDADSALSNAAESFSSHLEVGDRYSATRYSNPHAQAHGSPCAPSTLPRVLHAGCFPANSKLCFDEQCNCACAELRMTSVREPVPRPAAALVVQPPVHRQALAPGSTLLFNPLHDAGLAVLNDPALALWEEFRMPQPLAAVAGRISEMNAWPSLHSMVDLGLLVSPLVSPCVCVTEPDTLHVWLHVTNDCNLRCDYCFIRKSSAVMSSEIGRAAVDAVFRSANRHHYRRVKLKFAGGEPMLNLPRVLELSDYAAECAAQSEIELESTILSNGVVMTEAAIAAIARRGIQVSISLDGVGNAHDTQRHFAGGRSSFSQVERTIGRLLAHGLTPFISITVTNRNVDHLAAVVRYVLERRLPFNLNLYRDNDCTAIRDDLRLEERRLITAMQRAFEIIENNPPDHSLLGSLLDRAQFHAPHARPCSVGESYLVIDTMGRVAKCQMDIAHPVTDVNTFDPLEVLRADQTGLQNTGIDDKEGCRDCEWRYWCGGGCPVQTQRVTGRYDVKSPNCTVYRTLFPGLLRLEGMRLLRLATRQLHC